MAGRQRDVAGEECPRCGSRPGEQCRNYKGRGMRPHTLYDSPTEAKHASHGVEGECVGPDYGAARTWEQGELW